MTATGITLRELASRPVRDLAGVGTTLEARLADMDIRSVLDLLQHYPRRYVDRTKRVPIAELVVGEESTVVGEVERATGRRTRTGKALVEVVVTDGASRLACTFFNQAWRERQLAPGTEVALFGRLEVYRGKRQMTNPVVDVLGRAGEGEERTGVVVPIYPQSGKAEVFTWQLRRLVTEALRRCEARRLADPVPDAVLDEHDLAGRHESYVGVHRPDTTQEYRRARQRLIFDEFLRMQVGLVARKRSIEAEQHGIRHVVDGPLVPSFHARLPFALTDDQRRAIAEIERDLAAAAPMHRLLQGDVGSGKTVVALSALLVAVQGGYQGAFMAPTEVLAEQHHLSARALLDGLTVSAADSLLSERPVRVELLTNRTGAADRRRLAAGLASGEIDIVVGTHALLYDAAAFSRLGVAVIDEQHRFGVEQRALLRAKGDTRGDVETVPDVLVMTATPIPRTAAMLVYGDLDKSELREMPPGRTPITTRVVPPNPLDRAEAYATLRTEVAAGRQAYVVCPLVEGSAKVEAKAVTAEYERLGVEELAGLRLGLLHGQLPAAEKEAVMTAFRAGALDVLVATTVIEVGVDVPGATVMIIEDADRFGLSQLHQLRGRVGRGGGESWCFLFADPTTPDAEARLEAMAASTDGFLLAERDLEIRGAGEVFGDRQSGFSDLKLGRIPRDEVVVLDARRVAESLLDGDPALEHHRQLREEVEDLLGDAVDFLMKS
ncbi:MAG TPA: ATP-dependent DNA helicase RecG [Acidimicrobiia bacterium]|nr:ATP-dependent DNA helicase RecG [Acidimicrobiia bacterium]